MAIEVYRMLVLAGQQSQIHKIQVTVSEETSEYLNNRKRSELLALEQQSGVEVIIRGKPGLWPEHFEITCLDTDNRVVPFLVE
jgi:Ribonuclease G/E